MKFQVTRACLTLGLVCGLAVSGMVGCSEDGGGNNGTVINPGTDATPPDGGFVDTDPGADAGPDAEPGDDAGQDAEPDTGPVVTDLCEAVEDLGTLSTTIAVSGDTTSGSSAVEPGCGGSGIREQVYQFVVDQPLRVSVEVRSSQTTDWTLQWLNGTCDAPDVSSCEDSRADVLIAQPGQTYFLAVETAAPGGASYSLLLETAQLACAPVGSTTCEGDQVQRCEPGFQEVQSTCAYACEAGACGGDVCASALEVASGSQTFSGSYDGYGNAFNFTDKPSCSGADVGVNTPGQDLVFSLPGLSQGQTVTVDASADAFRHGIFVLQADTCSPEATCVDGGLVPDDTLEWTVPQAGDYYVVVDLRDPEDGDFNITISR